MAIQLQRQLPPRPRAFQVLATPIEGLLTPLAYGPAGTRCYAICLAPPAPVVLAPIAPLAGASCWNVCCARRRTCWKHLQ